LLAADQSLNQASLSQYYWPAFRKQMSTQVLNYLDAIAHLPAGGTLILNNVQWDEYEQLLNDLGDGYGVRISYDQGRLEVMSPSSFHEMYKELILSIALLFALEEGLLIESRGSTTFKQRLSGEAAEPDTCFYVKNAARVINRRRLDLTVDPPPDIIVEIDVSHESTQKYAFYASLGVTELWRYDEQRLHIYQLLEGTYVEISSSLAFPLLTSSALTQFLEQSKTEGQIAALHSFRSWLRSQKSE
jgi:Uma2 family endonuclease